MNLRKLIMPDEEYTKDLAEETTIEDADRVIQKEGKLATILASVGQLKKYRKMGEIMLMMIKDYRNGSYKAVPWMTVAAAVAGLLYVLSPIDLIPDFIPILGYVDDLTVMTIIVGWIDTDLHKYMDWKLSSDEDEES
jgi:uncharacterized membrane protein YkvA (DUF1232 family)